MKRIFGSGGVLLLLLFLMRFPAEALSAARGWYGSLAEYTDPYVIAVYDIDKYIDLYRNSRKAVCSLRRFLEKGFWDFSFRGLRLDTGASLRLSHGGQNCFSDDSCGRIGKREAEYLLTFTNHASPVFIYTYIIHICLQDRISPFLCLGSFFYPVCLLCCFFDFLYMVIRQLLLIIFYKTEKGAIHDRCFRNSAGCLHYERF